MKLVEVKVKVERETDTEITDWAEGEGRSKTRHVAILLRKLSSLRRSHPTDLARLGLLDETARN